MADENGRDELNPNDLSLGEMPNFLPAEESRPAVENVAAEPAEDVSLDTAETLDAPAAAQEEHQGSDETAELKEAADKQAIRSHSGLLLDQGHAPYQNDPDEKDSYFVRLQTPDGPEVIWGVDLERAMRENGADLGDPIRLDYMGSEAVLVDRKVRDAEGNVIGTEQIEANRNTWAVHTIDIAELEQSPVQPAPSDARPARTNEPDQVSVDEPLSAANERALHEQRVQEALLNVAGSLPPRSSAISAQDLNAVNAALSAPQVAAPGQSFVPGAGPTRGQEQVRTGAEALMEGGATLVGGTASLAGSIFKGVGKGAAGLAQALSGRDQARPADRLDADFNSLEAISSEHEAAPQEKYEALEGPGSPSAAAAPEVDREPAPVNVLPRLSEYRVDQVDRAVSNYEDASKMFWSSGALGSVREEIEAKAAATGLSIEDVMDKMKPDGDFAELHQKFTKAVAESPEAQSAKKSMDKAVDGFTRQFGRAQEELLNPDIEGNPHYEGLRDRLDKSSERMFGNAAKTPVFEGEDKSHIERLKEAVTKMLEKVKEMASSFLGYVTGKSRGKSPEAVGGDNAPSP